MINISLCNHSFHYRLRILLQYSDKGDVRGPPGIPGAPGKPGPAGQPGVNGRDGYHGARGTFLINPWKHWSKRVAL